MHCTQCSHEYRQGSRFCWVCGSPVGVQKQNPSTDNNSIDLEIVNQQSNPSSNTLVWTHRLKSKILSQIQGMTKSRFSILVGLCVGLPVLQILRIMANESNMITLGYSTGSEPVFLMWVNLQFFAPAATMAVFLLRVRMRKENIILPLTLMLWTSSVRPGTSLCLSETGRMGTTDAGIDALFGMQVIVLVMLLFWSLVVRLSKKQSKKLVLTTAFILLVFHITIPTITHDSWISNLGAIQFLYTIIGGSLCLTAFGYNSERGLVHD
jgi:hypothetical protein